MLAIDRLYSEPKLFDDLVFRSGLNLILGVPSDDSKKTNGVGKSVSIDFLNFALLSQYSDSRIKKVPEEAFPLDAKVCIDLNVFGRSVIIKRSREAHNKPTIIHDEKFLSFEKLEDAQAFLSALVFDGVREEHPSFRSMLGIFIRDERSEFKSIINGYDTKKRIADDYGPHLYLLGASLKKYKRIKRLQDEITSTETQITKLKADVQLLRQKKIEDARSDLNELDAEVTAIEESIENLENSAAYDVLEEEMSALDSSISELRRRSAIIVENLAKLEPIESEPVDISEEELREFYNGLKVGLGDLISRDFGQLQDFKQRIYRFQNEVISERRADLENELKEVRNSLRVQDREYQKRLKLLDQTGALQTLKQTFATYQEKSDQLSDLRSFITGYDAAISQKREQQLEKDIELQRLQSSIDDAEMIKDSFERTILDMHGYVMGNRQASFKYITTSKKQVVEISLRIDSDGSHSVEREKTFIYDFSLLQNDYTSKRHFGLLVHDNIFDVDSDTLRRNLNYIAGHMHEFRGQYILTLNSDRASSDAPEEMTALQSAVRARFTKANRFLKVSYQEN
ncbi:DUF2326 domain-containing protein [Paracoccus onubensis]|uniref:DUF2326 domain-containing protein n=1 Tax=Paracoccus onubensis TaxID=1675788 RepID=UPI00272FD041|nr:DUF2326 domain-containing protein [Paracoccus onubensis]MDP0930224.1 DUF2326 domain-containing protein [Paracoccus onubensis]